MNKNQFEAEVADFCRLYLCEYIDDYHVGYNEYDDDIQACVSIEGPGGRSYSITLILHPDREDSIAIRTYEDGYVEADGAGLYLWLWVETMNAQDKVK